MLLMCLKGAGLDCCSYCCLQELLFNDCGSVGAKNGGCCMWTSVEKCMLTVAMFPDGGKRGNRIMGDWSSSVQAHTCISQTTLSCLRSLPNQS